MGYRCGQPCSASVAVDAADFGRTGIQLGGGVVVVVVWCTGIRLTAVVVVFVVGRAGLQLAQQTTFRTREPHLPLIQFNGYTFLPHKRSFDPSH